VVPNFQGYQAFVRQQFQRAFRVGFVPEAANRETTDEIELRLHVPVLGVLAQPPTESPLGCLPELVTLQSPNTPASRACQALGQQVRQRLSPQQAGQTLLVTGPEDIPAQATTAANLAVVLARAGQVVALLDADARQCHIRQLLRQRSGADLISILEQDSTAWMRALVVTGVKNLMVVTGAPPADNGSATYPATRRRLDPQRLQALIQHLRHLADVVIINAPAAQTVETRALAAQAQSVLLMLEDKRARLPAALEIVQDFKQIGARLLGAVLIETAVGRR
jgi:Mrp family chromosome partitioning ATPase